MNVCAGQMKTIEDTLNEPRTSSRFMLNVSFIEATLTNPTVKIQDIPVSQFDGKIQKFPNSHDEFLSMIDKNEDLKNFQ